MSILDNKMEEAIEAVEGKSCRNCFWNTSSTRGSTSVVCSKRAFAKYQGGSSPCLEFDHKYEKCCSTCRFYHGFGSNCNVPGECQHKTQTKVVERDDVLRLVYNIIGYPHEDCCKFYQPKII